MFCERLDDSAAVLFVQTTVREALQYSAVLRLYGTRDKARIEAFVDEVMGLVELTPNRDALVREKVLGSNLYWE